jgi:hypothetical protein
MAQRKFTTVEGHRHVLVHGNVVVYTVPDGVPVSMAGEIAKQLNKAYQQGRYDLSEEFSTHAADARHAATEAQFG